MASIELGLERAVPASLARKRIRWGELSVQAVLFVAAVISVTRRERRSSAARCRRSSIYTLDNQAAIARRAEFVPLTPKQVKRARTILNQAIKVAKRS